MSAQYPTSVVIFTTKTNDIDFVDASHVNRLQEETVALQTYVGTNPQGSKTDLMARLAVMMDTNGALAQSNSFPASPVEGQIFWRTDQLTASVWSSSAAAWQSLGQSLSNVLFSYSGSFLPNFSVSADQFGSTPYYASWFKVGNTYGTMISTKFKKLSGFTSVTIWAKAAGSLDNPIVKVSLGTVSGSVSLTAVGAAAWDSFTCNVAGLVNGSTYPVEIEMRTTTSGYANLYSIIGIGA